MRQLMLVVSCLTLKSWRILQTKTPKKHKRNRNSSMTKNSGPRSRVGQYVLLHTTKVPQGLSPKLTALGKVLSICVDLVQQTSTCTKCADVPQQSTQVFYSCEQNQTLQRPRSSSKFGPTPSRWTNLLCLGPAIPQPPDEPIKDANQKTKQAQQEPKLSSTKIAVNPVPESQTPQSKHRTSPIRLTLLTYYYATSLSESNG